MPKTIFKGIALAAALSAGAMTLASPAEAGRRNSGAVAGAIIGLGAAAIIANSHRNRSYYYSYGYQPYYYAPPPHVVYAPAPVYNYAPPPWSPAWYRYCSRKYLSFDPRSGTFQPYRGPRRLCR